MMDIAAAQLAGGKFASALPFKDEVEVNGVKKTQTLFVPADYEKEIVFRTPEEMLKLGVGVQGGGGGGYAAAASGLAPGGQQTKPSDYAKNL